MDKGEILARCTFTMCYSTRLMEVMLFFRQNMGIYRSNEQRNLYQRWPPPCILWWIIIIWNVFNQRIGLFFIVHYLCQAIISWATIWFIYFIPQKLYIIGYLTSFLLLEEMFHSKCRLHFLSMFEVNFLWNKYWLGKCKVTYT